MPLTEKTIEFKLPKLPYDYNALEPYIDGKTMKIHHGAHHAGYVKKVNAAIEQDGVVEDSIEELMKHISKRSRAIRNNGGGHYNHSLFWTILSPNGGGKPEGELAEVINKSFGSFDDFKSQFEEAATSRFGSGWAWLIVQNGEKLAITSTPNQDNPLMDIVNTRGIPILGLDVWEHAYYLNYQNKRADYANAFWNVVNWDEVQKRYKDAKDHSI